ncbi:MAG: aldolase [SAR202 cluster bacterium]|nr:aldolase [SAR202 cluster bacterium]
MARNTVKAKLQAGGAVAGSFVNIDSPGIVEVLALSGLDFLVPDCEHSAITPEAAEDLYRAAEVHGVPSFTRVGEIDPQVVQKHLDAGSLGVQMPLVNTAADAARLVASVKYPPVGKRGLAGVRANRFGMREPLGEYIKDANEETFVIAQIETLQGIENADAIIATPGVDVIFLGPTDLSVALGVAGQVKHPRVLETIEVLARKAQAAGKVTGTIARNVDDFNYWRDRGVRYLITGASQLLAEAATRFAKTIHDAEAARMAAR